MKIIVTLSTAALIGCGTSDQPATPPRNEPTQSTPAASTIEPAKLGESRRDTGHRYYPEIAFTVLQFKESTELPTDSEFCPPAIPASNGKWVAVQVKVVNEGTEPVTLTTNANQSLYDDTRRYESEPLGGCSPAGLLEAKLQPGDQETGIFVWDVRPDVTPDRVELIVTDRHGIDRERPGALFSLH
ncbi:hypothetical protein JOF41_000480 [Saccharothrix coeruleofusca]|uniref:DUF4352 domain-containing protein n=1 Tax=Saccharothrix coeruleofusca TaxID=33919 RepID=UPI001AE64BE2|nr:DUF4352 domain-containing protein [Saccharothrix coeruleofusca]MBP2334302.1 hypothetical protein [Saccharothrix coeruleofusca]